MKLKKTKLRYNARKHKSGCLGSGIGGSGEVEGPTCTGVWAKELKGVTEMFLILIEAVVPNCTLCQNTLNSLHTH